jgi:integrase
MDILPVSGEKITPETGALAVVGQELVPVAFAPEFHAPSVYLSSLAPGSRRAMKGALELCAELLTGGRLSAMTLPWGALRFHHVAALRAYLADNYAPATANKTLSALKGTLKAAWRLGQMSTDDYQRAVDVKSVKGKRLVKGRMVTGGELLSLFSACAKENGNAGARDAAILSVMAGGGLRRSEVVKLDLADYVFDEESGTGELKVRQAKGNKDREAFIGEEACEALNYWVKVRGREPGPLFLPLEAGRPKKDGTSKRGLDRSGRRLNDQTIKDILIKRVGQSGIDDVSPHDFRRTFATNALKNGGDLSTVRDMLGHSSTDTTAIYDRRGDEAKRKTARLVTLPYVRPASALAPTRKPKRKKG